MGLCSSAAVYIRLERDMRGVCPAEAICDHVGMQRFESTGSFVGLYHADPLTQMPWIIAPGHRHGCFKLHQGLGAFVVPVTSNGVGIRQQKEGDVIDWLELLESHALMSFDLPDGITGRRWSWGR
jgi:hypothetical protein